VRVALRADVARHLSNRDRRRSFSTRPPVCSFGQ
jgi:hypothetical protein